jgi:FkbM family methyltransferase
MSILLNTVKHDDLIYDVGLHQGQDTDYYLKKGYRVIGFEASPDNAEYCRRRFEKEISDGRLTIVEGAITDSLPVNGRTTVPFFKNPDHSLWGSTSPEWADRNIVLGTRNEIIQVKAVDFGRCLQKYGIPHYLKADIVGSETVCLRAMLKFANKPDYLSIRSEKVVFSKLEYEFDLLEQLGYDRFKAVKQDFEKVVSPLPTNNGPKVHAFDEGSSGPFGEETAGSWQGRSTVLSRYRRIFVRYWLFGDYSYMRQTRQGRRVIHGFERVLNRSVPGWYDTHARHSSISS